VELSWFALQLWEITTLASEATTIGPYLESHVYPNLENVIE
jgi:hypothetical protein